MVEKKLSIFMKKHPVWFGVIIVVFCIFLILLVGIVPDNYRYSNSTGDVVNEDSGE